MNDSFLYPPISNNIFIAIMPSLRLLPQRSLSPQRFGGLHSYPTSSLAAAVRMPLGIHRCPSYRRPPTHVSLSPGFPKFHPFPSLISYLSHRCPTSSWKSPHFSRRQYYIDKLILPRGNYCRTSRPPYQLSALTGS